MFETLYDKKALVTDKLKILSEALKKIDERALCGFYYGGKVMYLKGVVNAIIDALNAPESTDEVIEFYFRQFELEFKKFYYVFKLEGGSPVNLSIITDYLSLKGYRIADETMMDSPYCITIRCDDEFVCADKEIPVFGYINKMYLPNIHVSWCMKQYEEMRNQPVKALYTGLSYTYYAIDKQFLRDVSLKLAIPSQDLFYDFEMLKMSYEDHKDTLQYVVAGLSPYSLRYDLSLSKGINIRTPYYHRYFKNLHHYTPDVSPELEKVQKMVRDIFGYDIMEDIYQRYYYAKLIGANGTSSNGWCFDESYISEGDIHDNYAKMHKEYPETLAENKKILKNYIDFCSEHNLKLFFLMPPYTNYYKENWNKDYIEELWGAIKELGDGKDYTILDFSDEEWPNYYFGDYAHLNEIGAVRFTQMLDHVIHSILV